MGELVIGLDENILRDLGMQFHDGSFGYIPPEQPHVHNQVQLCWGIRCSFLVVMRMLKIAHVAKLVTMSK